jgi:hypothetical protein
MSNGTIVNYQQIKSVHIVYSDKEFILHTTRTKPILANIVFDLVDSTNMTVKRDDEKNITVEKRKYTPYLRCNDNGEEGIVFYGKTKDELIDQMKTVFTEKSIKKILEYIEKYFYLLKDFSKIFQQIKN